MYEVNNLNNILSLKNKLNNIKMNKGESIQSYVMWISQLRDQLQTVREPIFDKYLLVTL